MALLSGGAMMRNAQLSSQTRPKPVTTTTSRRTTSLATLSKNQESFVSSSSRREQMRQEIQTQGGPKTIYLTFDDGPGPYTKQLLKILAQNQVQATFFVTNEMPKYQNCIRLESQLGHTVGVHSYSHDYAKIYCSSQAFWNDYQKMDTIIVKQTGHHAWCFRFPGGSSNTVSRRYCSGIMSTLSKQAQSKGLDFIDWNASAGDAEDAHTPEAVKNHIIRDMGEQSQVVVLCHDIKPYTVQAMNSFISWGKSHGYQFKPLTPHGYIVHHHINN